MMGRLGMSTISIYALVMAIVVGLTMVATGSWVVSEGFSVKAEIEDALVKEQVITSGDAPIPGVLVQDAETAKAQQDAIETHTYGRWGPYSSLDREDPNRETYVTGLTLRNSLNMAVMGFGVADLAIAVGAIMIVLGTVTIGFAVPVHYMMQRRRERTTEEMSTISDPVLQQG